MFRCSCDFQLEGAGKTSHFANFNDHGLSDGRVILDLVDACKPGSIKYDHVKDSGSDEVCDCACLMTYYGLHLSK